MVESRMEGVRSQSRDWLLSSRRSDFGRGVVCMLYLACTFTSIFAYTQDGSDHTCRDFFNEN